MATITLANLLTDPIFSDLQLKCEGQTFHVHRCVVCSKSPVLAAACKGGFVEAEHRVINVTAGNAATVKRLIEYMYTGDYDDVVGISDWEKNALSVLEGRVDDQEVAKMPPERLFKALERVQTLSRVGPEVKDKIRGWNTNKMLIVNARVYILAEYYQMPGLKELAAVKFGKALAVIKIYGFAEVIDFVYNTEELASARDLQDMIDSVFIGWPDLLKYENAVRKQCFQIPEMMQSILPKLITDYDNQLRESSRDIRKGLSQVLAVEREKRELAESRLQAMERELDTTRQLLHAATSCSHCGKGLLLSYGGRGHEIGEHGVGGYEAGGHGYGGSRHGGNGA